MKVELFWVFLLPLIAEIHGRMEIFSIDHLQIDPIPVYIINKFIGPSDPEINLHNVSVVYFHSRETPRFLDCDSVRGAVYVWNSDSGVTSWKIEERLARLVEACGGVALVRTFHDVGGAGSRWFMRDSDCCRGSSNPVSIPYLSVEFHDFSHFVDLDHVRGTIAVADPSPWARLIWESQFFLVYFRIFLPSCNGLCIILALIAIVKNSLISPTANVPTSSCFSVSSPRVVVVVELAACVLRVLYCSLGPFSSSDFFTWSESMFLVNISLPMQVLVLALGSELFLRVIASHNRALPYSVRLRRRIFLVAAFVSILLELVSSALREIVVSKQLVFMVSACVSSLVLATSSFVFLRSGMKFLLNIRKRVDVEVRSPHTIARERLVIRFTALVMGGCLCQLIELVCLVLFAASPSSPQRILFVFTPYYTAFSLSSLFHILAFTPQLSNTSPTNPTRHRSSSILSLALSVKVWVKSLVFDPTPDGVRSSPSSKQHVAPRVLHVTPTHSVAQPSEGGVSGDEESDVEYPPPLPPLSASFAARGGHADDEQDESLDFLFQPCELTLGNLVASQRFVLAQSIDRIAQSARRSSAAGRPSFLLAFTARSIKNKAVDVGCLPE